MLDRQQEIWTASLRPMATDEQIEADGLVSQRLRHLRETLGFKTQQPMAELAGVEIRRWNNYENGFNIPVDIAIRLCQKVAGLTTDWIYRGNSAGLSVDLARRLGELGPTRKSKTRP